MSDQLFKSKSSESIRIFKSNFLNALSKCKWYVPAVYWVPISAIMIYFSVVNGNFSAKSTVLFFIIGFLAWSFFEYLIHRFIFHWEPKKENKIGSRIHFLIHGVHHDYPNDRLRLVAPPSLSTIIAIPLFGIFYLIYPHVWVDLVVFSGTIIGYVLYDSTHYWLHHSTTKWRIVKKMQKHHLSHHYTDDQSKYGVSLLGIFWDYVFGTK